MQRVRVISFSSKKSLPPLLLPSRNHLSALDSPISQPTSPLLANFPSEHSPITPSKQCSYNRTRHTSLLVPRPTTPALRVRFDQPPDLTSQITSLNMYSSAYGGYGDVWMATWDNGHRTCTVAVKVLRPRSNDEEGIRRLSRRLRREIHVWKRLKHPNIVPLFGTTSDFGPSFSTGMVSPWMHKGDLDAFLRKAGLKLSVDDRLQILCDIASGLMYLHSRSVIHGDLTSANVLINDNRVACLVDFGMSSIKAELEGSSYWPSTIGGAIRWRAPELLPRIDHLPILSSACDIYSFGSITLHVLSGKMPYYNVKSETFILLQVFQGVRPRRPPTPMLIDSYWSFITQCWNEIPSRLCIDEVHRAIIGFRKCLETPSDFP